MYIINHSNYVLHNKKRELNHLLERLYNTLYTNEKSSRKSRERYISHSRVHSMYFQKL
jgi:hypothetical protein